MAKRTYNQLSQPSRIRAAIFHREDVMRTKNKISLASRTLYGLMILGMMFSTFGSFKANALSQVANYANDSTSNISNSPVGNKLSIVSEDCITPSVAPQNYPVANSWGEPLSTTERYPNQGLGESGFVPGSWHLGEDIYGNFPDEVRAVTEGYVTCIYTNTTPPTVDPGTGKTKYHGYGRAVFVQSIMPNTGEPITTIYMHLSGTNIVTKGTILGKGDKIGEIATMNDNGGFVEHLHIGIRHGHYLEDKPYNFPINNWGYLPINLANEAEFKRWKALQDILQNPPQPQSSWQSGYRHMVTYIPWWYTFNSCDSQRLKFYLDDRLLFHTDPIDGSDTNHIITVFVGSGSHVLKTQFFGLLAQSIPQIGSTLWPNKPACAAGLIDPPPPATGEPQPLPGATPPPISSVDNSKFVLDVTLPDGSLVSPNQILTKTQ